VHGVPRFGHQRQPCLHGSQLLLNSRGLCDTTNFWAFRVRSSTVWRVPPRSTASRWSFARKHGLPKSARSGSTDRTTRHRDTLTCPCGFEGHADLTASETFLKRQTAVSRSMARPVCLKWDDHRWSESPRSPVPTRSIRTRKLPPWAGKRYPSARKPRVYAGEDVIFTPVG